MANIKVKGRYRVLTYDGTTPFDFTSYANQLCSIRTPNPVTFVTISQYIPGGGQSFTSFQPGSSYTIVTKSNTADFTIGNYTRGDRLPSSVTMKFPNFYYGLDKNSITVPLSNYALSVNQPLSTVFTYIPNQNGFFNFIGSFNTERYKQGLIDNLTHLQPGSSYQFRNRVNYTLFAPLKSEMGDAWAWGNNVYGQFGMGHLFNGFNLRQDLNNNLTLTAERLFGVWEDMVISSNGSVYALSACGNNLKMFVTGNNLNGKLGIGNENNLSVFYQLTGNWSKISSGYSHTLALSSNGKLFAVGSNTSGQLGLGSSILSASTFTQVNSNIYSKIEAGGNSSFVIDQNGALYGCGTNTYGQLGLGNTNSPIYSFTRESLNGTFQLVLTDNARTVVLSSGRMLGTGLQQNTTNYATGDLTNYKTFVQECSGFTDIEDIQLHSRYSFLKRTNDSNYWYFGYIISAPSFQSPGYFFRKRTINRSIYPKRNSSSLPVYDNSTGSSAFYYVDSSSKILYKLLGDTGPGEYKYTGKYDKLFFSRTGNNQTFIALSATDNFRPTPSPTITPTITPTATRPFLPYNLNEVGIFGSSFQINTLPTSKQSRVYNTPGNFDQTFTYESTNNYTIVGGNSFITTFDYEKSSEYNNIVGISKLNNSGTTPGRYHARNLFKKVGSNWIINSLPQNFDAVTNSSYGYRNIETGTDTLLITPPLPNYTQGIYNLMFIQDQQFKEAISYDRGNSWNISQFSNYFPSSEFNYDTFGCVNKILYSRTRDQNYEVQAVGYTGLNRMGSFNQNSLYFSKRFPIFSEKELVFEFNSSIGRSYGFDFKHDYRNVPTIASVTNSKIYLHRRINGEWKNNPIKENIELCQGPYYQVPESFGIYKRLNSPVISVEFDSTNPHFIYIAYLKHTIYFDNNVRDPAFINVLCYNTFNNTVIFDENVVSATYESGSLRKTDSQYIDIPTLFYDTKNNTLNLFFYGIKYNSPTSTSHKYYKMKRLGNDNWTSPNNLYLDPTSYMTNSWELKTKY
jgi:hypothetical protein